MSFGNRIRAARIALNLSQVELAEKVGIYERSVRNYEQAVTYPKPAILKKLADALNVSVKYLTEEDAVDEAVFFDQEEFVARAKKEFGAKGAREAAAVLERATALFAGGDLNEKAKDTFIKSLTEVYLESKAIARDKFSPRKRVSPK